MSDGDGLRGDHRNYRLWEACDGGAPIPRALRRYMTRLLGTDLDDVKVVRSAGVETLEATAVTAGDRVVIHPST